MEEPLEHIYFNWLCAKVLYLEVHSPSTTYWKLFRRLYETEFVWLVVGDDSRAADGLDLRDEFLLESGFEPDEEWRHFGCSVFEVLIAFARRADFQVRRSISVWFWEFLGNLHLAEHNDARFNLDEVDDILYKFVWREYDELGNGGLFPLTTHKYDLRAMQIWYQFFAYLEDQEQTG
jgi:hypothetical protein